MANNDIPINLKHALAGMCTDPDCELHCIDVAIEEEVVDQTNVAFWLSGAAFMARNIGNDEDFNRLRDELMGVLHRHPPFHKEN